MQTEAPSFVKPALIAGIAFGVAAAIPFIGWINCLCCALVIACGLVAAYLQSQQCAKVGAPFAVGDGALVGLVAGLFYGVANGIMGAIMQLAFGVGDIQEVIEQIESSGVDMDPAVMEQMTSFMESTGPVLMALIGIFVAIVLGAIFSTLGGLIGGALFKKEGPPPTAPMTQTPPPYAGGPPTAPPTTPPSV
jgi:uncharacterized protein involved in cysteine biosynthesis